MSKQDTQMILDDADDIRREDKMNVVDATQLLYRQCEQAWSEARQIDLPSDYKDVTNVVVVGMGGSHLGAQVIRALYRESLKVPLTIQSEYTPQGYVNENTLVLATSYSGNTEEPLSFVELSKKAGAKIVCIASGGKLVDFAAKNSYPLYHFSSKHNPSAIPRYGAGYLFMSQMAYLSRLGFISLKDNEVRDVIDVLKNANTRYDLEVPTSENDAKQLAKKLKDTLVVLVSSEHLAGSAHIFKNQINESAKNFSTGFLIPELDHHLLEGLTHPKKGKESMHFVFIESDLYHEKNSHRHKITRDVVEKQGIGTSAYKPISNTKLTQAFETIAFTSNVALYLSILNRVDPGPNPWVDYLKEQLAKF